MIADILENKEKIVAQFINAHSYKSIELDFDILKILQNFKYLNKKCNFDKINKILKYSIKNHDLKSLNILDFFEGLSFKAKIVRCRLLDLDYSKIIDVNEISENLVHYVNKLPKSYFDYNKEKFKDCEDILFQIYPDLSSQSNILKIIENSKNAAKILPKINDIETIGKIETVILSKYVVSDYIYVLTNTKLPEQLLPLFLFSTYKHKKIISEKIKAKYLIEKYFDEGFITYILKSKLVCIFDFVNSIHVKIKDSNIKNCIFFQDEFYYLNSIFYENFENVQMSIENYNFFHNILNILNTDGILSNCNTEEKFSINFLKSVLIEILCLEIPKFLDFDINDRIYTILDISNPYFCFKILLDHYFKNKKKFEIIYMYYKKFIVKNKNFKLEIFKIIQGDHKNLSYLYKNKFQKNLKFCEENFISYASIYLITKKGRKYDDSYYKFYQKVSNKRVKDLLLEYLIKICDVHYSIKHVDEHLKVSKTIINKFRHSANSINICIESLMDISDKSLSYLLKLDFFEKINHFMIIKYIENNTNIIHPIYNKRQQIFEIFYDKISIAIAAKIEQKYKNLINLNNLNDKEKFNDLCENFFGEKYSIGNINEIYTILFLKSLSNIKNSEILRFFEIQLDQSEIKEKILSFSNQNYQELLNYNFPLITKNITSAENFIFTELTTEIQAKTNIVEIDEKIHFNIQNNINEHSYDLKIIFDKFDVRNTKLIIKCNEKTNIFDNLERELQESRRINDILKKYDKKFICFFSKSACCICFEDIDIKSVVNPILTCKTCKNQIHAQCINRWHQVIRLKKCPLCKRIM
ncbi:hypothetical protein GVAV_001943 [Gurleya vavrai]